VPEGRKGIKDAENTPQSPDVDSSPQAGEQTPSDKQYALATTQFVLDQLAVLMAPFTPFFAEDIYKRVGGNLESVHLESWPKEVSGNDYSRILENMRIVREAISDALELRAKAGIKVRQPLGQLTITQEIPSEYIDLIKDEVNVKDITAGDEMKLDTELTDELIVEGNARELIREIQKMRKTAGLNPEDEITLSIATDEAGQGVVEKYRDDITNTAGVTVINFTDNDAEPVAINDLKFGIVIE
jgi:isoleucyl-tRNA synthetase